MCLAQLRAWVYKGGVTGVSPPFIHIFKALFSFLTICLAVALPSWLAMLFQSPMCSLAAIHLCVMMSFLPEFCALSPQFPPGAIPETHLTARDGRIRMKKTS